MFSEEFTIAWPFFFASVIALGLVINTRNRKRSEATLYFALCMLSAGLWSFFSGMHLIVDSFQAKVLWSDAKFLFVATLPVFWLLLAWTFSNKKESIATQTLIKLFFLPAITVLLVATNGFHYLVFSEVGPLKTEHFESIARDYGPWFWIHTVYSYTLFVVGIGVFIQCIFKSKGHFRAQAIVMASGSLAPFVFNAIYLSNPLAFRFLDYTPVAFAATGVVYFLGLFKFKMLDLMPIAQAEIVRSMEDVVIVTDLDGIIVDANEAASMLRIGRSGSEVGHPIVQAFPLLADVWSASKDSEKISKEIQVLIDSTARWYRADVKQIFNASGKLEGKLVVLRDVSDAKKAQIQLQEAKLKADELSHLKSAFLSNMSHDVRTPLAGIIGMADLLIEECEGDHKEFALMIRQSGHRLLKQLNSLLSVSHLSAGKLDHHRRVLNLVDVVSRLISSAKMDLEEKQVQLHVSLPDIPLKADLDPDHLSHAISHILDHAVRYTNEGSVHFDLSKERDEAVFRISDTGRGFEPEFIRSIGQVMGALELAELGLDSGSGLGLRVAHGLIEEMGGRLLIKTEPGLGSVFTVRLPLMTETETSEVVQSIGPKEDRPAAGQSTKQGSTPSPVLNFSK
jgi:signal transduction histidine kinase